MLLAVVIALATVVFLPRCKKAETMAANNAAVSLPAPITAFTILGEKLGLQSLAPERVEGSATIYRISAVPVGVNEEAINLDGKEVILTPVVDGRSAISFVGGKILTLDHLGRRLIYDHIPVADLSGLSVRTKEVLLLVTLYLELTDKKNPRKSPWKTGGISTEGSQTRCEWTVFNVAGTESTAIRRTENEAAAFIFRHSDCRLEDGVDTGCLWGNFYCVATQTISCSSYCFWIDIRK